MNDKSVQQTYLRCYGAVAINDLSVAINEIGNKFIELNDNDSDEVLYGSIAEIIKEAPLDRALELVDYLQLKKPEWEKVLLINKLSCLSIKGSLKQIIDIAKDYESKYGRDQYSITALLNAYLAEGYIKHVRMIKELTVQLKTIMEG